MMIGNVLFLLLDIYIHTYTNLVSSHRYRQVIVQLPERKSLPQKVHVANLDVHICPNILHQDLRVGCPRGDVGHQRKQLNRGRGRRIVIYHDKNSLRHIHILQNFSKLIHTYIHTYSTYIHIRNRRYSHHLCRAYSV